MSYQRMTKAQLIRRIEELQDQASRGAGRVPAAALEEVSDFLARTDPNGGIIYLNQAGRRLVGAEGGRDLTGLNIKTFYPPWVRRILDDFAIPEAVKLGAWRGELSLSGADGRKLAVNQVILAHRGAGGELQGLVFVVRDITHKRAAEHRRVEYASRLSGLLLVSTRILAQLTLDGLLKTVAEAARDVTGGQWACAGLGHQDGSFASEAWSGSPGARVGRSPSGPGPALCAEVASLMGKGQRTVRLGPGETSRHSGPWPSGGDRPNGLMGAHLLDMESEPVGLIVVMDKQNGQFTDDDEALLAQLANITSLALRHIQARREAEESQRILRALMDYAPVGIAIADAPDCRLRMVSREALGYMDQHGRRLYLSGAQRGFQLAGFSYLHDSDDTSFQEPPLFKAIKAGETTQGEECLMRTASGQSIVALTDATPIRDRQGAITGGVMVWHDISGYKHIEQELSRRERLYRTLTANLPGIDVFMYDRQLRYQIGEGSEMIPQGFKGDSIEGRGLAEVWDQRTAATLEPVYRRALKGRAAFCELEVAGTTYHVRAVPLLDDAGEVVGGIALNHNVTEQKRIQRQLRKAKEAAESANTAKSLFLSNMSHEIRTPLNALVGLSHLLRESDLDTQQRGLVDSLINSSELLVSLVEDILDFSKIEASALELFEQPFDLLDVVDEVLDILSYRAAAKGLDFNCHIAPDLPAALIGDGDRIKQILINLLGNAIKFTDSGEVVLRIMCLDKNDGLGSLRFEISDTGPGVEADQQEAIFKRFSRLESGVARDQGGTGLGLAICKQLVEMMGGGIGLNSRPGKGSRFWFTLDLKRQPEHGDQGGGPLEILTRQRVLVAKGKTTNRDIVADYLDHMGCAFDLSESVEQTVEALHAARRRGRPFTFVLAADKLPGGGAKALARRLEGDEGSKSVVFICLAEKEPGKTLARERPPFYSALLRKPVTYRKLSSCLMSCLGQGQYSAQAAGGLDPRYSPRQLRRMRSQHHILLVEDNETNRLVALGILGKLGYRAQAVASGEAALEALAETRYDLVLMDIRMPGMDGVETVKAIRDLENDIIDHDVPVLALTANATRSERESYLAAGMDGYLSKPIRPVALARAIDERLPGWVESARHEGRRREPPKDPVWDREDMVRRMAGDEQLAIAVIRSLLADLPRLSGNIRAALEEGRPSAAAEAAHTIKGSAANASAVGVSEAARRLQNAAEEGSAGLDELLRLLDGEISLLQDKLRALG